MYDDVLGADLKAEGALAMLQAAVDEDQLTSVQSPMYSQSLILHTEQHTTASSHPTLVKPRTRKIHV